MTDDFWAAEAPFEGPVMEAHGWARLGEQMAGLGYWRLEVASKAISWSEGLFRLYGLPVGELPDLETAMAAIHPDDSARANALLKRAMEDGVDYSSKVRLRRADGSWRILVNRSTCHRGDDGAVATVFGAVMDVTEMELANEALRDSEARYRLLAENGNDLIVQTDLQGRLTYISPSVLGATGYAAEELVGDELLDIIHPDDVAALTKAVLHALNHPGDPSPGVEYRVEHKDGRTVWLESRPAPLIDAATGRSIGATDVVRVVTERKALEQELVAKCAEAQAATLAKAQFLANMSHEIRTPLTAIMGFSGLLEAVPAMPQAARGYLKHVRTAGAQLLDVVNDVLDFSKLDGGQMVLDCQPLDPAALLVETMDLLTAQAAAKGLRLEANVAPGINAWVLADGARLRQILLNLTGNAVKFTAKGAVTVSLAPDAKGSLKITVADTGPGIAPEMQGRLFERFSQVNGSINRDHGGTGLGLAISKGLVELMGGRIGLDSTPGCGARFWFTFPAPEARRPAPAPRAAGGTMAPAHMLIVDDVAINRQLVRAMLEPLGHTFDEAANGAEAVQAAMQRPFDLILMDLQMPGMDGMEATRAIRANAPGNRRTPIVALSANVLEPQIAACSAAGMDDHLAKPIVPAALVAAVAKWTGLDRPAGTLAAA